MRICVYGAGAIGGALAGKLAHAGQSVSVVARGAQLDAIRSGGLRVIEGSEEFAARIPASDDPRELGLQDVVFVTVKAYSLPSIAVQLPALLGPGTPVVFALNGIPWWYHAELTKGLRAGPSRLDPEGLLLERVGLDRSVGCVLYSYDQVVAPGIIRHTPGGAYVLGEPAGEASERCAELARIFTAAGLEATVSARIRTEIWNKLFLNLANGAVCCLTGCTLREVARTPELRALSLRLMHEAREVAIAHGVQGLGDPEKMLPQDLPPFKPSMQKDLELGRQTEFEAIYAAVGDFARAANVPASLLDTVITLLKQRTETALISGQAA